MVCDVGAIQEMSVLNTEKEVRGFLGCLQYISKFISKLTMVCDPIFKLLRKHQPIVWDEHCQEAFNIIKEYMMKPSVLKPPKDGKPLFLYLALEKEVVGAMVGQYGPNDVEHVVYYLSKNLLPYKSKYNLVEMTCLAMIWLQGS
ncbi:uncharacterized protein LOC107260889 [Ricinus communis]|uniref:uncharacterized protein LOC107260889 n=1 Tax=Ricinus communis TaxID=3988 RepID=UPI0007726BD5|nr:uncharacterized protein LOC107260889 [Ricinus communis]|eukprot:XP_015571869.1 uncharacterized protein LOC107260889 [Ricinus communis]